MRRIKPSARSVQMAVRELEMRFDPLDLCVCVTASVGGMGSGFKACSLSASLSW